MSGAVAVDFTYELGPRDEIWVRELACVDIDSSRMQSFSFERHPSYDKVEFPFDRFKCFKLRGGYIDFGDIEVVLHNTIKTSSAIFTYGQHKADFLEKMLGRSVINLQKGTKCPPPTSMCFTSVKTCMDPDHIAQAKVECPLRNADSLAHWVRANHLANHWQASDVQLPPLQASK